MKTIISTYLLAIAIGYFNFSLAQTTIADGNWSDPMIWQGYIPPITTGNVVINHHVVMDQDYAHVAGTFTIGANGSLTGNSPMRGFALNYPSGTATMTNNGVFKVNRTLLASGVFTNNGLIECDSLLNNSAALTNGVNGTIDATQFMNNAGGSLINNGHSNAFNFYNGGSFTNNASKEAINLFNANTIVNNSSISANDFCNAKTFTNESTGYIKVTNDFSNIDTIAGPANFTNDGYVLVNNNWHNNNTISGSGKFCIGQNSWNSGTLNGTLDICDATGGNIDLNTGTVAGTITYCTNNNSCFLGLKTTTQEFSIAPNPFSSSTIISTNNALTNASIVVENSYGQTVSTLTNINGTSFEINGSQLPAGIYFVHIRENNQSLSSIRLIVTK
ncbi:MAG: T9SS type A sorting domain-containing protein [Crocinitomicaceae bacterium]|nr:T9SS type A sorting domain-containing protein [Crocinitomicaceae bacterium]